LADIYSYGIILWELITRELPFKDERFWADIAIIVVKGGRPKIPDYCPVLFQRLITSSWVMIIFNENDKIMIINIS
jgi:hypothetical protein